MPWSNTPIGIGAGGFCTGLEIADNGAAISWGDYPGLFYRAPGTKTWIKLLRPGTVGVNGATVAANLVDYNTGPGTSAGAVYYAAIHPTNPQHMLCHVWGILLISHDTGATWAKVPVLPTLLDHSGTQDGNKSGRKIAFDPADTTGLTFMVGTFDATVGLWRTTNGGANGAKVASVPTTTEKNGMTIEYDRANAGVVYVGVYNTGFYKSTNSAVSFAAINTTGMPTVFNKTHITRAGVLIVTSRDGTNFIKRYSGSAWTTSTGIGNGAHGVTSDPATPARVWVEFNGQIAVSTDSGATFPTGYSGIPARDGSNIAWAAWTPDYNMGFCNLQWDSQLPGFGLAMGIGYYQLKNPPLSVTGVNGEITYVFNSEGIESMVMAYYSRIPVKAFDPTDDDYHGFAKQDRGAMFFKDADFLKSYAKRHWPENKSNLFQANNFSWALDDPRWCVGAMNQALWQSDHPLAQPKPYGPYTESLSLGWKRDVFGVYPDLGGVDGTRRANGLVMARNKNEVVYFPCFDARPLFCDGLTVINSDFGSAANTQFDAGIVGGFNQQYYNLRQFLTRDDATGDFYCYLTSPLGATGDDTRGVWKSTTGGRTFLPRCTDYVSYLTGQVGSQNLGYNVDFFHKFLKHAPSTVANPLSGHLFYSAFGIGGGSDFALAFSNNGGTSWSAVGMGLTGGGGNHGQAGPFGFCRGRDGSGNLLPLSAYPWIILASSSTATNHGVWVCKNFNPSRPDLATWDVAAAPFMPNDQHYDAINWIGDDITDSQVPLCFGTTGAHRLKFTP